MHELGSARAVVPVLLGVRFVVTQLCDLILGLYAGRMPGVCLDAIAWNGCRHGPTV